MGCLSKERKIQVNSRVLGYKKAFELSDKDLLKISGGVSKLTCHSTARATGVYPGKTDGVTDQVWD